MMGDWSYKLLSIPAVLIAITIHEYAHGYAAWKLGDPTAKYSGRLSLNPLHHLHPIGALMMLLVGFGWAKPVPVNPRYFKHPRKGMAIVSIAGPFSNIIMAFLSALLYAALLPMLTKLVYFTENQSLAIAALQFLYISHILNLSFALFNLIPLPPLDGSKLLFLALPQKYYHRIMQYERQISLFFVIWLLLGSRVAEMLLSIPIVVNSPILNFVAKCLSLTGWLSSAVNFLSDIMFKFLALFPFLS